MDYTHSDGSSAISIESSNSGVNRFPDLESTREAVRLSLDYRYSERLTASVQLAYENFDVRDWALAGVDPDTIPTVLTLGADPYDYDVFVIGLGFRYSLGRGDISLRE